MVVATGAVATQNAQVAGLKRWRNDFVHVQRPGPVDGHGFRLGHRGVVQLAASISGGDVSDRRFRQVVANRLEDEPATLRLTGGTRGVGRPLPPALLPALRVG